MKKGAIIILFLLCISLVSAAEYRCSDGSALSSNLGEVNIDNTKSINGLRIGLINADAGAVSYSAELIIDADELSLSSKNSTKVELKTGEYTVVLLNLTEGRAKMRVDGETEDLEVGDSPSMGDLVLFLTKADGDFPGTFDVEAILGKREMTLNNKNLVEKTSVADIDYLLELVSATNTEALIKVKKCETEDGDILVSGTESESESEEEGEDETDSCTEDWLCQDWSECIEGNQTRECFDTNSCGTESDKPFLIYGCQMPKSKGIGAYKTGAIAAVVIAVLVVVFFLLKGKKPNPNP